MSELPVAAETDPPADHTSVMSQWMTAVRKEPMTAAVFALALGQFAFFTLYTLNQPLIDMYGFRPAQTAISIPYMLSDGAWLNYLTPIFGEPWIVLLEFPLFQWCVALLTAVTGLTVDAAGRLTSAAFAVGVLWPAFMLSRALGLGARFAVLATALWLLAPVVVYWGRAVLIETTSVFLGAVWLAYYVRFMNFGGYRDFAPCLLFGVLAALVKVTALPGFLLVGAGYTLHLFWQRRDQFAGVFCRGLIGASTVAIAAAALMVWSWHSNALMLENPLSSLVTFNALPGWYFGTWQDRTGVPLWEWTIYIRALGEGIGLAWLAVAAGWLSLGPRSAAFWTAPLVVIAYLGAFLLFPKLHIVHNYYQVENVLLLTALAALVIDSLLRTRLRLLGYAVLACVVIGQLWTFYSGYYFQNLQTDYHKHPFYLVAQALAKAMPPEDIVVAFGLDWASDLPYLAHRRAIMVAHWFPVDPVRTVVLTERQRWFGGRKLGAVVDCGIVEHQKASPAQLPIRDELIREMSPTPIEVAGCRIYVRRG